MTVIELIKALEDHGIMDAEVYIGMETVGTDDIALELNEDSVGIVERGL